MRRPEKGSEVQWFRARWTIYGQAVLLGDREALGLAVVIAVGLVLLRRGTGTLGAVFLSLVFGDFLVWTMWAAMNSLRHGEQPEDVTLPAVLAVLSLTRLVAARWAKPNQW